MIENNKGIFYHVNVRNNKTQMESFASNVAKLLVAQCLWLFVTPWTIAYQAPLSMEFFRQKYWSGLPFPSPADLPDPGIKPRSPALESDSLPATREAPNQDLISVSTSPSNWPFQQFIWNFLIYTSEVICMIGTLSVSLSFPHLQEDGLD